MGAKRNLDEIVAEIPSREELEKRFKLLVPSSSPPELRLPTGLDIDSPYALFSLFISEDIIQSISQSTNEYAQRKRVRDNDSDIDSPRPGAGRSWKDTTAVDIKVFFGILIYMGVHDSPRIDHYWRQDPKEGPLHLPRLYMSQKRFEQIKRFLHIARPDAAIARAPFGDDFETELDIPAATNDYNYHMGGVDIANPSRATYEIRQRTMRTWFPLFFSFLDAAIVNAYRFQYIAKKQQQTRPLSQLEFREKLCRELFLSQAQARVARPRPNGPNQQTEARYHQRISLDRRNACVWCQYVREKGKRGQQASRGKSGCRECGVALCLKGRCWDEFHSSG